ncbi:hypothetical protein E1178_20830 [Roseibium hamelinense]|nr:hypothetical protein [Roseibium hamelinense]
MATGASAKTVAQETYTIPEDQLAVTVASATPQQADPLNSDLTIWVGEIELQGRNTIWVELIDGYGEVIYNSEVLSNETHLLPDGRAVVVRSIDPATKIAKTDESRVPTEGNLVVTRRVVQEGNAATSVEFIEATEEREKSTLLHVAEFGQSVWTKTMAFFQAAADRIQIAWNWLVDTLHA